jgi:hypothetical protein
MCIGCGASPPVRAHRCAPCAAGIAKSASALTQRRMAKGMCRSCSSPPLAHSKLCLRHWAEHKSTAHFGHVRMWEFLIELGDRQGWRCHYTGEPLTPGDGMSLDHLTPRASADYPGDNDLSNLAWTTRATNRAKADRTEAEFLALCQAVVRTRGQDVEGAHFAPREASTSAPLAA